MHDRYFLMSIVNAFILTIWILILQVDTGVFIYLLINHVVFIFEGHLDDETLHYMSMPRCGVRDKVGFATDSRSRRYALQGKYKV